MTSAPTIESLFPTDNDINESPHDATGDLALLAYATVMGHEPYEEHQRQALFSALIRDTRFMLRSSSTRRAAMQTRLLQRVRPGHRLAVEWRKGCGSDAHRDALVSVREEIARTAGLEVGPDGVVSIAKS